MKKPLFKRWYFWVIIIFLLIGFGGSSSSTKTNNETKPTEEVVEVEDAPEPEGTSEVVIETYSLEDYVIYLTKMAEDSFPSDTYDKNIYVKDNTVFFELSAHGLVAEILSNPKEAQDLSKQLLSMSTTMWETEKELTGKEDVNFVFSLLNDTNKENCIILINNDTIIYDAIQELVK